MTPPKKKSYNYKKQKSADERKINQNASQYKTESQKKYFQFIHHLNYKGYLSINQSQKKS